MAATVAARGGAARARPTTMRVVMYARRGGPSLVGRQALYYTRTLTHYLPDPTRP